jgi:hypothetical protein
MVETAIALGVRWVWLKVMYTYTIVLSGGLGLGLLVAPTTVKSLMGWPAEEPVAVGIVASTYVAFGILSILGMRAPLTFVPVLLLQLTYKVIWFVGVFLPLAIAGQLHSYVLIFAAVLATYIVGDLIAIPFRYVFGRHSAA